MSEPTFEQKLTELEEIVRQVEMGDLPLESLVRLFERGQQLASECEQMLADAELQLRVLENAPDGSQRLTPYMPPENE